MQTLRKAFEEFLKIEDEFHLFERKIDGVYFWELVRSNIFLALLKRSLSERKETQSRMEPIRKLLFYLKSLLDFKHNPYFCGEKDILFSGGQRRVLNDIDGLWWDMHVDPLLDNLNYSYVSLEYAVGINHRNPAKTPKLRYYDFIEALGFIRRVLGVAGINLTSDDESLISDLRKRIQIAFQVEIDVKRMIVSRLQERKETLSLCIKLLKQVKPKLVVIVTSYAREILVEACKLLGIPIIELQHGVITRYHPGYSYPSPNSKKLRFPDYLLVFGQWWKEHTVFPIPLERVIVTGFPYLEAMVNIRSSKTRKKQIIIISQNRLGELISKFALELSKVSSFDYEIVYKLHPLECDQWKEMYPWLVNANLTILDDPKTNLYNLFSESEVQVGVASTAVYEGVAFGLKTYILDMPGSEYSQPLIDSGQAYKVSSVEAFINHLSSPAESNPPDVEYLFASHGVNLTHEFITSVMDSLNSKPKIGEQP